MATSRPASPALCQLPPSPGSPSFSHVSTTNPVSEFSLPPPPPPRSLYPILSKEDIEASQTAYADLLTTAKAYRLALTELSVAASTFGSALEACARLKEARSEALHPPTGSMSNSFSVGSGTCTADALLAASGVQQLIANHQHILSETVYRSFEIPLLHELDGWRRGMEEEDTTYRRDVKEQSQDIRKLEREGLKLHKLKRRDVGKFRTHLVDLTKKLDGLTSLHGNHSRSLLRDCQDTSFKIVEASSSLVRAEIDIFEALARKGWNGGGLDDLLEKGRDLFANEDETAHAGGASTLFSVLPQKSILANIDSRPEHQRGNVSLENGDMYRSLDEASATKDDGDVRSIFSAEGNFNKSRGVRPFSPPAPLLRNRELEDSIGTRNVSSDVQSIAAVIGRSSPMIEERPSNPRDTLDDEETRGRGRGWSLTTDDTAI